MVLSPRHRQSARTFMLLQTKNNFKCENLLLYAFNKFFYFWIMKPNAVLLIFVICIFLLGNLTGCFIQKNFISEPCLAVVKSDTVRVVVHDSATVNIAVKSQPNIVKQSKLRKFIVNVNGNKINYDVPCDTLREIITQLIPLADTSFYSDTLRNDTSHNIVINDTIVGQRLGLGIEFKNLRPMVKETVTNTVVKKIKPQIYLGAIVGLNNNANNYLAAPSVAVSYKAALLNYSFDIKNEMHMVGGYVRVFGK